MDDHHHTTTTAAAAAAAVPPSSSSSPPAAAPGTGPAPTLLPRVTIRFCTQCKWMLRAAYYAQELLSTFSTALGEVALQPSTGGTFVVDIVTAAAAASASGQPQPLPPRILWDRKTDGGFPETKELKRRVRDVIEPGRDLGHVDRNHAVQAREAAATATAAAPADAAAAGSEKPAPGGGGKEACEDCQA